MNVVLYTQDFEPITVLDLPLWLLDQLERVGAVRVAVVRPLSMHSVREPDSLVMHPYNDVVTIYCEKLRWRDGRTKPVLVTPDETLALLLKPEWLPGQRQAINAYKQTIRSLTDQLVKALRK